MSAPDRLPLLGRLLLSAFLWVFFLAGAYLLLDSLDLWPRIPAGLARGIDVGTGLVLVLALVGHLLLATGALPAADGAEARRSGTS